MPWWSRTGNFGLVSFFRKTTKRRRTMSEPYPWYGKVEGELLEQGDFLQSCPVYHQGDDGVYREKTANGIVLSHSCDLANDKLEIIQVGPYWPLEKLAQDVEYLRH